MVSRFDARLTRLERQLDKKLAATAAKDTPKWATEAASWHRQQAFNWDGLASNAASIPSDSECKLMAEIHRYMAERIDGDVRAKQLYERVLLFPVNP